MAQRTSYTALYELYEGQPAVHNASLCALVNISVYYFNASYFPFCPSHIIIHFSYAVCNLLYHLLFLERQSV